MNIILRWARSLYRKAILKHLIAPEIVVLMDGGICSHDSSGLNVPPVAETNVPGIAETNVPAVAE